MVRISFGGDYGTGFIFRKDETGYLIGTAKHVVNKVDSHSATLTIFHAKSRRTVSCIPGSWRVVFDHELDVAIIRIPLVPDFQKAAESLMDGIGIMPKGTFMKPGTTIGWLGFPNMFPEVLSFFSGRVSAYIPEKKMYLLDGVGIHGVSGGPVFYNDLDGPLIIGIVSQYHPNLAQADTFGTLPGVMVAHQISPFHDLPGKGGVG